MASRPAGATEAEVGVGAGESSRSQAGTRELRSEIEKLRLELAGVRAQLERRDAEASAKEGQLKRYAADLRDTFKEERTRTQELHRSYMSTVRALANAVEARDAYTGKHAERVAAYAVRIAGAAGLDLAHDVEIEFGFLLHDVGKVAVPDAVLFKPGALTPQERLVIELHPLTGAEIVKEIEFLGAASKVIRSHHERWDGHGYPDGLRQDEIPVAARIFAVADALDALTTERPYRSASPFRDARLEIIADAGSHFDPTAVAAFESISDETFENIRRSIG